MIKRIANACVLPLFAILAGVVFCAPITRAQQTPPAKLPPDQTLTLNVVSPHGEWAKPYALGKLRVLFLTRNCYGRDVTEVAERMDVDADYVTIAGQWHAPAQLAAVPWSTDIARQYVEKKLTEEKYDAVVIVGESEASRGLSDKAYELLAKRQAEGMGIVWISPYRVPAALAPISEPGRELKRQPWLLATDHFITRGIPLDLLPPSTVTPYAKVDGTVLFKTPDNQPIAVAREKDKSRSVAFAWRNPTGDDYVVLVPDINPYLGGALDESLPKNAFWEYHYSALIRAILWVSHKEPTVEMTKQRLSEDGRTLRFDLLNPGNPMPMRLDLSCRDDHAVLDGETSRQGIIPAGDSTYALPVPASHSAGLHSADLIIRSEGKVVNWGSASFVVPSDIKVKEITADKPAYRRADSASIHVVFDAPLAKPCEITNSLYDSYEREVRSDSIQLAAGAAGLTVDVPLARIATRSATVRFELKPEGGPVVKCEKWLLLFRPITRGEEWSFGINGFPEGTYRADTLYKLLWDAGVNAVLYTWTRPSAVFAHNYDLAVGDVLSDFNLHGGAGEQLMRKHTADYPKTHDKTMLVRPYCCNNPEQEKARQDHARKMAEDAKAFGVTRFMYVDEMWYSKPGLDYCFCDYCMKGMREWLKTQYKDLAELNLAWGTSFAKWDDAVPYTLDEAREHDSFASWSDHRIFEQVSYGLMVARARNILREVIPEAELGASGTQPSSPWVGDEVFQRMHTFDYLVTYSDPPEGDMMRSFAPPNYLTWGWCGWSDVGPGVSGRIWRDFFLGCAGSAYWHRQQAFNADWTYSDGMKAAIQGNDLLRRGVYRLLTSSKRQNDGIAVLYSMRSLHGQYYSERNPLPKFGMGWVAMNPTLKGWAECIKGAGLQFDFVLAEELPQDVLSKGGYRALVLPCAIALSDEQVAKIRSFVEKGGILIADFAPALMDGHCAWRATGALDDVFGVKRNTLADVPSAEKMRVDAALIGTPGTLDLPVVAQEATLGLTRGEQIAKAGKAPGVIGHNFENGKAVYLNLAVVEGAGEKIPPALQQVITAVFKQMGLTSTVKVQESAGVFRWTDGDAEYVGLLGRAEHVTFADKRHVYNLTDGKYLGLVDRFERPWNEKTDYALMLARLPYKVDGIELTVPDQAMAGAPLACAVQLKADTQKIGRHIVNLSVFDASGHELVWYMRNIELTNGQGSQTLDLALNESPTLTLRVRDIVSGVTAERVVHVNRPLAPSEVPVSKERKVTMADVSTPGRFGIIEVNAGLRDAFVELPDTKYYRAPNSDKTYADVMVCARCHKQIPVPPIPPGADPRAILSTYLCPLCGQRVSALPPLPAGVPD